MPFHVEICIDSLSAPIDSIRARGLEQTLEYQWETRSVEEGPVMFFIMKYKIASDEDPSFERHLVAERCIRTVTPDDFYKVVSDVHAMNRRAHKDIGAPFCVQPFHTSPQSQLDKLIQIWRNPDSDCVGELYYLMPLDANVLDVLNK